MNKLNKLQLMTISALMTLSAVSAEPAKKQDFTHEFMAGLESYKYHYGESKPNRPNFMQDNGVMFGINAAYQLSYRDCVFIQPEARAAYGLVDYTNDKHAKLSAASIPTFLFEPRLLMGGHINLSKNFKLSPFIGIGYRYKSDDTSQIQSYQNQGGTKRLSQYWYVPLGSRLTYDFNDRWFVKVSAEYDWFISGRQFSYKKERYPSPLVFKQNKGWGAKGELLIGHRFDRVSVALGPYMSYWKIAKSKDVMTSTIVADYPRPFIGTACEPRNITKEIGVKLNFYF